jgi:hypothetical protein
VRAPVGAVPSGTAQDAAGMVRLTPGPVKVQDVVIPEILEYEMRLPCPICTRVGAALRVPLGLVHAPPPTVTLPIGLQVPPAPVHVRLYVPAVPTTTEPLVALPVENPLPEHTVAFVDDQVRVEGILLEDAEREQVGTDGGGATGGTQFPEPSIVLSEGQTLSTSQFPQLFSSFDSDTWFAGRSAQRRAWNVPAEPKVYAPD